MANELPSDLQSNFRRAWAKFSDERFQECRKRDEFKACLFGLGFYHRCVLSVALGLQFNVGLGLRLG